MSQRSHLIEGVILLSFVIMTFGVLSLYVLNPIVGRHVIGGVAGSSDFSSRTYVVTSGAIYEIEVEVADVHAQEAEVNGTLRTLLDRQLVEERTLTAKEKASPQDYSMSVRENATIVLSSDEDCQLTVEWYVEKGDKWDITIYERPPEGQVRLTRTYGLVAVFGMILLLVSRVKYGTRLGEKDDTAKRPDWREDGAGGGTGRGVLRLTIGSIDSSEMYAVN